MNICYYYGSELFHQNDAQSFNITCIIYKKESFCLEPLSSGRIESKYY